jgi:hypothetical protein
MMHDASCTTDINGECENIFLSVSVSLCPLSLVGGPKGPVVARCRAQMSHSLLFALVSRKNKQEEPKAVNTTRQNKTRRAQHDTLTLSIVKSTQLK